jgi:hypothetical protein
MVHNNVLQAAHVESFQFFGKRFKVRFPPQLRIQLRGIDDVITVETPFARFEHGGSIQVGNAELGKIGNNLSCSPEVEPRIELDPIGCYG